MKTGKSLLVAFFLLIFLSGCAPDAVDAYNRPIKISDYRGKWVVISYWATWCAGCIQEIPDLNKLATYYKDKVVVLGVNVDRLTNDVLRSLGQSYGARYPFLGEFPIERWGGKPEALPVTFIISPKGKLYTTLKGPVSFATFQSVMSLPEVTYY